MNSLRVSCWKFILFVWIGLASLFLHLPCNNVENWTFEKSTTSSSLFNLAFTNQLGSLSHFFWGCLFFNLCLYFFLSPLYATVFFNVLIFLIMLLLLLLRVSAGLLYFSAHNLLPSDIHIYVVPLQFLCSSLLFTAFSGCHPNTQTDNILTRFKRERPVSQASLK